MDEGDRELVFVYGTLRKGASNHWRMEGAEFLGRATVRGRLYLVDWYPALRMDKSAREVIGEVFEVSAKHLEELDAFEGEEYERVKGEVMRKSPSFRQEVWLYRFLEEIDESELIESGDWLDIEHPPGPPVFLWIAWSPILLVWPGALVAGLAMPKLAQRDSSMLLWVLPSAILLSAVVMLVGGAMAIKRREQPRGLAAPPIFFGSLALASLLLILLLIISGL